MYTCKYISKLTMLIFNDRIIGNFCFMYSDFLDFLQHINVISRKEAKVSITDTFFSLCFRPLCPVLWWLVQCSECTLDQQLNYSQFH